MTGRVLRLAGAQTTVPACSVPIGSFVYDTGSLLWVEVTAVATAADRTALSVIADHDVPLEYGSDEPVAVCDAFTLGQVNDRHWGS
jgi:hypothetical protein